MEPILAPMPGRMPIHVPMTDERTMFQACALQSLTDIRIPLVENFVRSTLRSMSTISAINWLTANTPISTGRRPSPPFRYITPQVRRGKPPAAGSTPGIATNIPSAPESSPLTIDPWLTEAISTMAMTTRVKYSNGPNRVAKSDKGSDTKTRNTQDTMPPTNDAAMPKPSARPGWPLRAMG